MRFDMETVLPFVLVGIPFLIAIGRIIMIKRKGIEADAVVIGFEDHDTTDGEGMPMTYTDVLVRYRTQEGRIVEAALANAKNSLCLGERVMIKYIPGREDNPVLA